MVSGINPSLLSSLFGGASNSSSNASAAPLLTPTPALAPISKKYAPTAPWTKTATPAAVAQRVKDALAGHKFVDENATKLDLQGASADYRKLFALYNGLSTLMSVAEESNKKNVSAAEIARFDKTFAKGLTEVIGYVGETDFDQLRLVKGAANLSTKTTTPVRKPATEYATPALVTGSSTAPVPAFQGAVKFDIAVKRGGKNINIAIDLSEMGGASRTVATVVNFLNDKLEDAGVDTRIQSNRIPGEDRTTTVNGKTVSLGPGPDQWGLKVKVSAGETLKFTAPDTAGAVYVAQDAGNPDPDGNSKTDDGVTRRELVKFQTDIATVAPPLQKAGEQNWVDGRVFSETLGPEIKTVRSTKTAGDGSVYMLADVSEKIEGQDIKGAQDVALLKYDSAGKLIFARTLGAAEEATGLALTVSADGSKVAIAGSVKGDLNGATNGALNSDPAAKLTDSFVTVYDSEGQEQWTQRRGARAADEASQIAFGADGTVYVAGRAKSALPGSSGAIGDWDSYLEAFKADAKGVFKPAFTTSFGTTGSDRPSGLVVDGTSLVTASIEGGHAVLRRFDISGGSPVETSSRDLGDLQGGDLAGLALDGGEVVVAGSTRNSGLTGATVTRAFSAGMDAFAARFSADLSGTGKIAFYGGSGDDKATALAVSGGDVWIAGSAGADLPNYAAAVGVKDAFLAKLDVDTGAIDWSRRFTGKDRRAAPTSIAVDASGASVLDRIGLPKGELDMTESQFLTAASSLRAGDQFTVRAGSGRPKTVTIEANETLDTLAQKIRRASGFQATVKVTAANGQRYLSINPNGKRAIVEFGAGSANKDALELLGIPEGVIRQTEIVDGKSVPADRKGMLYGLGLDGVLSLKDETERKHALAEIGGAMGRIREAYKDLKTAASPPEPPSAAAANGKVPAHLTAQIANYQAALSRLTGGG